MVVMYRVTLWGHPVCNNELYKCIHGSYIHPVCINELYKCIHGSNILGYTMGTPCMY